MKIGFIGIGRMGSGMARRLLFAGHDLAVHDHSSDKTAALAEEGARADDTVAALASDRDVVITMLADDAALESVAVAPGGLVESLPRDAVHVAMGTHGVEQINRLVEAHGAAGQHFVAAPVLGRPDRAAKGQLGIIPGGPEAAVDRLTSVFAVLGSTLFPAGENPASACAIKVANNFVLGCAIEALAESMALVRKYDVEPALFQRVLTEGIFSCIAYQVYGDIMVAESYDKVGVTTRIGLKDAHLALSAGAEIGLLTPPLGLSCFAIKSTLEEENISLREIFTGAFPFALTMLLVLVLIINYPRLSLALL